MITIENLQVTYDHNRVALDEISLKITGPTITGIIGPNGAGKSTFIKAMLNIVNHQGKVVIDGQPAKNKLKKIAYVEQKSNIDYTFPIKVKECVSLGTYANLTIFQRVGKEQWQKVSEALDILGVKEFENRQISALSGGQFQRVLLARCLVQDAEYIFLDEPFVGIDSVSEKIIMETLTNLKKKGKTILIVHHDLNKVKNYFDQLVILNQYLIAFGKTETIFTQANLKKAYGETVFIGGMEA